MPRNPCSPEKPLIPEYPLYPDIAPGANTFPPKVVTCIITVFTGAELNVNVDPVTEYADCGCNTPPTDTIVKLIFVGVVDSVNAVCEPVPVKLSTVEVSVPPCPL